MNKDTAYYVRGGLIMRKIAIFKHLPTVLVFLLAGLLVTWGIYPAFADELTNFQGPIMVVTGTGQVDAQPDRAKITLAVVSSGQHLEQLQEQNSRTVNQVVTSLLKQGLQRSQIETSSFSVWPQYSYGRSSEGQPPQIIGYQVRNQITVTLHDPQTTGSIIDTALKAGANEVQNLSYYLSDSSSVQAMELSQACINANKKANAIARALGLKIGAVISVKESSSTAEIYPVRMLDSVMVSGEAVPIQPADITVSGTVTITYQILK